MSTSANSENPAPSPIVEGTWDELLIHPTRMMTLVVNGVATIIGKDGRGRHLYRMTEATRDANQGGSKRGRGTRVSSSKPE